MSTVFETFKTRPEAVSAEVHRFSKQRVRHFVSLLADAYRAERAKEPDNANTI